MFIARQQINRPVVPKLADDANGNSVAAPNTTAQSYYYYAWYTPTIAASTLLDIVSKSVTCAAKSRQAVFGFLNACSNGGVYFKAQLYAAGVQIAESAYLNSSVNTGSNIILMASAVCSGATTFKLSVYNYDSNPDVLMMFSGRTSAGPSIAAVAAWSMKATT